MRAEEMGAAFVTAVVSSGVPGVELLQCPRDPSSRGSKDGVVVVAEERIIDQPQLEPFEYHRESIEKVDAIAGLEEKVAIVASVRADVVEALGEGARSAWHAVQTRPRPRESPPGEMTCHTFGTTVVLTRRGV
jgi:hypothetical protein